MAHPPRNGNADQMGWQKAGSRPVMASSLSGQAQARSLAPPRMWGGERLRTEAAPDISLESFQTGRGYESTPHDKVQTTTWPGSREPAFCLPSTAQPDQAPKSPHAPAPLTSRMCIGCPWPRIHHSHLQLLSSPISSSTSFPLPQAGSGIPSEASPQAPGSPGQP